MATSYIKGNGLTQDGTSGVDRLQYNCGAVLPERALTYWLEWEDFNTKDKGYVVFVTDKFGNVQSLNGDRVGNFFYKGNKVYVETSDIRIQYKMGPNVMWKVEDKPAGTTGITKASSEVTSGAGTPPTNGQYLGQLYVNTSTGDVYAYKTGGWVKCAGESVLPASTSADKGKILQVQADGTSAWNVLHGVSGSNPCKTTDISFCRSFSSLSAKSSVPIQHIKLSDIAASANRAPFSARVSVMRYGDSEVVYEVAGQLTGGSSHKLSVVANGTHNISTDKFAIIKTDADGSFNVSGEYCDLIMYSSSARAGAVTINYLDGRFASLWTDHAGVAVRNIPFGSNATFNTYELTNEQISVIELSNTVKYSVGVPVTTSSDAGKSLVVKADGTSDWNDGAFVPKYYRVAPTSVKSLHFKMRGAMNSGESRNARYSATFHIRCKSGGTGTGSDITLNITHPNSTEDKVYAQLFSTDTGRSNISNIETVYAKYNNSTGFTDVYLGFNSYSAQGTIYFSIVPDVDSVDSTASAGIAKLSDGSAIMTSSEWNNATFGSIFEFLTTDAPADATLIANVRRLSAIIPATPTSSDAGKVLSVDANGNSTWDSLVEIINHATVTLKGSATIPSNKYVIFKLFDYEKPTGSAGVNRFHFQCTMYAGKYNLTMPATRLHITGTSMSDSPYVHANMAINSDYDVTTTTSECMSAFSNYNFRVLATNNADHSGSVYLCVRVNTNSNIRLALTDIYYDPSCSNIVSGVVTSDAYDEIGSEYVENNSSLCFIPVPYTTTADNGKILKVVNGVPAWVSA